MLTQTLMRNALNEGTVPLAQKRLWVLKNSLGMTAPGAAAPSAIPPRLTNFLNQVERGLESAGAGTPPPPPVVTLAFYDDFDGAFKRIRRKAESYFWFNFFAAIALVLLFLGAGVATIWAALFKGIKLWEGIAGAGLSLGGLVGMFVWKPVDRVHAALIVSIKLEFTQARYRAQIESCKAGKDPKNPQNISQMVECISAVTNQLLADLA